MTIKPIYRVCLKQTGYADDTKVKQNKLFIIVSKNGNKPKFEIADGYVYGIGYYTYDVDKLPSNVLLEEEWIPLGEVEKISNLTFNK